MSLVTSHAAEERSAADIQSRVSQRKAILVLGMHRSGTSAMTRLLGLCGAALPRHPMAARESNPLGHWEPQRIVDAHDAFLADAGTAWDEAFDYRRAMFTSPAASDCRRKLTDTVLAEYGDAPLFVLKDPRTSRLMPLWRPVLTTLKTAPHIVIMVRNPLEVAGSLKHREGWGETRGMTLWLRYMLRAERDTRDLPRCFIAYDALIDDWPSAMAKLSTHLGIAFPVRDADTDIEIDGFIRRDLRHHRSKAAELQVRADLPDCIKQAYRCFAMAAETGDVDYAALDAIAAALDSAEPLLDGRRHDVEPDPARQDALLALALAELDRASNQAERSQRMLQEVRASWSWRLTRPFRVAGRTAARLLPVRPSGRA